MMDVDRDGCGCWMWMWPLDVGFMEDEEGGDDRGG